MRLLFVFLAFSGLANAQNTPQEREFESIQKLIETLKELTTDDLFCSSSTECKALPIGEKGCGGPREYIITSLDGHNSEEITYLAERTRIREHNYNSRYPREVDCAYIKLPETRCVNQICGEKK